MDRLPPASPIVSDAGLRGLLAWSARDREITSLLHRGCLGYGEFILRRQMNHDRLMLETADDAAPPSV